MKHAFFALIAALALAPCAQASSLGRLFFTPEQRAQLEYDHTRSAAVEGDSSSVLTVNGIVQRHGGGRTVWINGVPQNAGNSDERNPESLAVAVPGKKNPVKLKVGQRLLLDNTTPQPPSTPGE